MGMRRILVTRAEPGAARTCAALAALGYQPINAATAHIRPRPATLDRTPPPCLAITSPNGANRLVDLTTERDWPVFTVGNATAAILTQAGFSTVHSAAGDVEALAARIIQAAPGRPVLHLRGADQAGALTDRLRAAGLSADDQVVYAAEPVSSLSDTALQALETGAAVLIHSPKGAERFIALTQTQVERLQHTPVIAISTAAAAPIAAIGATDITIAARPDQAAVLDAVQKRLA